MLFVASLFGITLNQGFFVLGLSYTTPIDASVVASLAPIITMILAAFIQKEPMTGKKVVGVFMGLSGALMLILNGAGTVSEGLSGGRVMGDLFCLVAEISFAKPVYTCDFDEVDVLVFCDLLFAARGKRFVEHPIFRS